MKLFSNLFARLTTCKMFKRILRTNFVAKEATGVGGAKTTLSDPTIEPSQKHRAKDARGNALVTKHRRRPLDIKNGIRKYGTLLVKNWGKVPPIHSCGEGLKNLVRNGLVKQYTINTCLQAGYFAIKIRKRFIDMLIGKMP